MELLIVMALIVLLGGATLAAVGNFRVAGMRDGAANQILHSLEEARMLAIEKGVNIHVGFAGDSFPDPEKRRRSFMIFRDYTADELAKMTEAPAPGSYVHLTEWRDLPRNFYLDNSHSGNLLSDNSASQNVVGLSEDGEPVAVHTIAFSRIGRVVTPQASSPRIDIVQASYNSASGQLIPHPGGDASTFSVAVSRLTGRLSLTDGAPASAPAP